MTWEFYNYSKGNTESLQEFWKAQEERGCKDHKVYSMEKSVEIMKSARVSNVDEEPIKMDEIIVEEVDGFEFREEKIGKDVI